MHTYLGLDQRVPQPDERRRIRDQQRSGSGEGRTGLPSGRALATVPQSSVTAVLHGGLLMLQFASVLGLTLAAVHPAGLNVQEPPILTGTWKMVSATGDRSQFRIPDSRTAVIEQSGATIHVRVRTLLAGRRAEQAYTYSTAGGERVDSISGGGMIRSTARWEGAVLVVRLVQSTPGGPINVEDRYELSSDGATLTIRRTMDRDGVRAALEMVHTRSEETSPGPGQPQTPPPSPTPRSA